MGYYSPSKINTYLLCPLKYRFAYVDKIKKDEVGVEAFLGTCVHNALERMLYLEKEFDRKPSYDLAEELFLKAWDELYHPEVVIRRPGVTAEDYRRRGLMMLSNFFEIEDGRQFGRLLSVEKYIRFPLGDNEIGGKIDRLHRDDDTIHIIDYKTSSNPMSQIAADSDMQLALYELGVRQEFPDVKSVELHWYMLGHSEMVTSVRDEEARRLLAERVCRIAAEIESASEFRPNEGGLCGWCEYQEECADEKRRRVIKRGAKRIPPACELADEYAALHAKKKALDSELKDIEEHFDRLKPLISEACRRKRAWSVEGSDCVLDVSADVSYGMPSKESPERLRLEAVIRDRGLWEQVSEVSKSKVLKAIDDGRLGKCAAEVKAMFDHEETCRIKIRPRE